MRATFIQLHHLRKTSTSFQRIPILAWVFFMLMEDKAHANPVFLQIGVSLDRIWITLIIGLVLMILIFSWIIRRPLIQIIRACFLANTITGFIGFVSLLYYRMHGIPSIPVGPAALVAFAIESIMFATIMGGTPLKRIFLASALCQATAVCIAVMILLPGPIQPSKPGLAEDIALANNMITVRNSIETYNRINGFYPWWLSGGNQNNYESIKDPLIASGILESYPPNPYAPYLKTRRINLLWMLTGLGIPIKSIPFSKPLNDWENRWFPLIQTDPRFGNADLLLLSANGLSEPAIFESRIFHDYCMNGSDYIPGCFFYKAYDFNLDGLADDYILGFYGWPGDSNSVLVDLIDAKTGDICLRIDSEGNIIPGMPDGDPEVVAGIYVANTPLPES